MNTLEASAQATLANAEQLYTELLDTVESRIARLPDTASVEDVERINSEVKPRLDALEADVSNAKRQLDSAARITRAREASAHLIPRGNTIEVREESATLCRSSGQPLASRAEPPERLCRRCDP